MLLPYILFLVNISLSVLYLYAERGRGAMGVKAVIIFSLALPLYSIADRASKDYGQSLYAEIELRKDGGVALTCRPGFADSRQFYLVVKSLELAEKLKANAQSYKGSLYISDLQIVKSFPFRQFLRLKIKAANGAKIAEGPVWKVADISGDLSFLRP
ncbi:hypothetical protein [Arcticibacter tournemirensis]|uniref:hypothetical protein n=1 Tax=Arcticibacter tournemirensis TaxID=699437 RepID=UPI00114F12A8|nr:hypothetical protein [Arcticibacter tournemirensis]